MDFNILLFCRVAIHPIHFVGPPPTEHFLQATSSPTTLPSLHVMGAVNGEEPCGCWRKHRAINWRGTRSLPIENGGFKDDLTIKKVDFTNENVGQMGILIGFNWDTILALFEMSSDQLTLANWLYQGSHYPIYEYTPHSWGMHTRHTHLPAFWCEQKFIRVLTNG